MHYQEIISNFLVLKGMNFVEVQLPLIIYLLDRFNFRISEVLRINKDSLVPPKSIIVKLSKCKDYFVISDKELYSFLHDLFYSHNINGFLFDRFAVYRYIQKFHPNLVIQNKSGNNKVTHSFRYRNTQDFEKHLRSEKEIQALLKHRSIKSQKYYRKNKKNLSD